MMVRQSLGKRYGVPSHILGVVKFCADIVTDGAAVIYEIEEIAWHVLKTGPAAFRSGTTLQPPLALCTSPSSPKNTAIQLRRKFFFLRFGTVRVPRLLA